MKTPFIYKSLGLLLVTLWISASALMASSHREAPLIADDPLADNVDVYAFRSPDDPSTVTLIATYIPLQLPQAGPNYYNFGENIRYEIHVDNDAGAPGDEIIYRFTFDIVNEDPSTFFNIRLGLQNQKALYTLERSIDGGASFETIITDGLVPPNNIGTRSISGAAGLDTDYKSLFEGAITTASTGERVFAGPSDDPFFVDLGGIFDLGDAPRQTGKPVDGLKCFNVHTLAIQVPISTLLKEGAPTEPTSILDSDYVIGVWASASRPAIRTLRTDGEPTYSGDWVQVSRLGMPLTNEAVIAIGDKDYWNSITPYDELADTRLDEYFFNPELALYMDDDLFGGAVPAFAPLRIQTNSLGAFDFSNGADGLFGLKGSEAVAGTALDDAVFGTLLLPEAGKPRSVDLWPAFHTGVPNVIPYQLATGKEGNPLAAGKPFVNNFLPNGGDMLRLNMAVPVTPRDDANFSSLGLIQAAAIGLTVAPFNTSPDLEFIPNMDGFPNGRRLEDDVTRIELQAVAGAVLAAVGLWYDDFDPATSESPVTEQLLNVLTYTTGVEENDRPFLSSFPYVAMPASGTGDCSGVIVEGAGDTQGQFYVSSNNSGEIGVYDIDASGMISMSTITSEAMDADGIHYEASTDVLYQLNRSDNVVNAYSNVSTNPILTATSSSDFTNGREIAFANGKLIVTQDANDTNGGNRLIVYDASATSITLNKTYDVDINLWGIHLDGERLFAIVDNSDELAVYDDFLNRPAGILEADRIIQIEGIVRTHGITYDAVSDIMVLTDVGSGMVDDDGAFSVISAWMDAAADGVVSLSEQVRVAGDGTDLGNPVDIAYDPTSGRIYIAERANGGGRVLGFETPTSSGSDAPFYNELFAGASAIFFTKDNFIAPDCEAEGGMILSNGGTEETICAGDGNPDPIDVVVSGAMGEEMSWIITDAATGEILGLPMAPPFDLEGAGPGICNIYHISHNADVMIPVIGGNINELMGCFDLSNPIVVTREDAEICNPTGCQTPTNVSVQEINSRRFSMRWSPVSGARNFILRISLADRPSVSFDIPVRGRRIFIGIPRNRRLVVSVATVCADGSISPFSETFEIGDTKSLANNTKLSADDIEVLANAIEITEFMNVYPNPATEIINVAFEAGETASELQIIDTKGQLISRQNIAPGSLLQRVNISELSEGSYFVQMTTQEGELRARETFVKISAQ